MRAMTTLALPTPPPLRTRRHRHRPGRPGALHQPLQPAAAAAAVPVAEGRVRRQLHRARLPADDLLRRLLRRCRRCRASGSTATARGRSCSAAWRCWAWRRSALRSSQSYWMLAAVLGRRRHRQRRVPPGRLHAAQPQGRARRGWAMPTACTASPAAWAGRWRRRMLVPITLAYSLARRAAVRRRRWRSPCWRVLWLNRGAADARRALPRAGSAGAAGAPKASLDFLKIPAVWMCFGFFFFYAGALSHRADLRARGGARSCTRVPAQLAAMCLTVYMVCARRRHGGRRLPRRRPGALRAHRRRRLRHGRAGRAGASASRRCRRWRCRCCSALMGFASGMAGPSRDLLVKRSAPDNATGRVYGVVYSGLDIGQARRAAGLRHADGPRRLPQRLARRWRCCRAC